MSATWVTYRQLAQARRIAKESAEALVRRKGWQRRPSGDGSGLMRFLVPEEMLTPSEGHQPDVVALRDEVAQLRREVAEIRERLGRSSR